MRMSIYWFAIGCDNDITKLRPIGSGMYVIFGTWRRISSVKYRCFIAISWLSSEAGAVNYRNSVQILCAFAMVQPVGIGIPIWIGMNTAYSNSFKEAWIIVSKSPRFFVSLFQVCTASNKKVYRSNYGYNIKNKQWR